MIVQCLRCNRPFEVPDVNDELVPPTYDAREEYVCENCLGAMDHHISKAEDYLSRIMDKKDPNEQTELPPEVSEDQ